MGWCRTRINCDGPSSTNHRAGVSGRDRRPAPQADVDPPVVSVEALRDAAVEPPGGQGAQQVLDVQRPFDTLRARHLGACLPWFTCLREGR